MTRASCEPARGSAPDPVLSRCRERKMQEMQAWTAPLVLAGRPPHTAGMRRMAIESPLETASVPPMRPCGHPGCAGRGDFRAPRSKSELNAFYWFCLDHVRAYNAAWNYYAGMSEAEIEAEIRSDTVWQRPTWPLGSRIGARFEPRWRDDGLFDADDTSTRPRERKRPRTAEGEALGGFELTPPLA